MTCDRAWSGLAPGPEDNSRCHILLTNHPLEGRPLNAPPNCVKINHISGRFEARSSFHKSSTGNCLAGDQAKVSGGSTLRGFSLHKKFSWASLVFIVKVEPASGLIYHPSSGSLFQTGRHQDVPNVHALHVRAILLYTIPRIGPLFPDFCLPATFRERSLTVYKRDRMCIRHPPFMNSRGHISRTFYLFNYRSHYIKVTWIFGFSALTMFSER